MEDGIRFAETAEERHAAFQLRYKTYVTGLGLFNDSCDHVRQELKDAYDENARIVVVIKNHTIIGSLRVLWGKEIGFDRHLTQAYRVTNFLNRKIDPAKICIIERLVVDESHRGSAAMLRMFNVIMNFVLSHKIELLLINAESQHIKSYIKLGCVPFSKPFLYPDVGPVNPMALVVGDYSHLQRTGSPFSLLMTADDTRYCQHTRTLLNIIQREAIVAAKPTLSEFLSKIPTMPAANHPVYTKKSSQMHERLRQRLSMA